MSLKCARRLQIRGGPKKVIKVQMLDHCHGLDLSKNPIPKIMAVLEAIFDHQVSLSVK